MIVDAQVIAVRSAETLDEAVARLTVRAETEQRLIVSWSRRELDVINESPTMPDELKARFAHLWRDGKVTAKNWKRLRHRKVKFERIVGRGRHRLDEYFKLIGYTLPSYFGDRKAAARIGYVRAQLGKRGAFASLTPTAKSKWTKLLDYNWHDCNGLREVALIASANPNSLDSRA